MNDLQLKKAFSTLKHSVLVEYSIYGFTLLFFSFFLMYFLKMNQIETVPWGFWVVIYFIKSFVEVIACFYALFYILVAISYRKPKIVNTNSRSVNVRLNVDVAYLCCDDFDYKALSSIVRCLRNGSQSIWIHDDSTSEINRIDVDDAVEKLKDEYNVKITIFRRSKRIGGKPGAVNSLLSNLPSDVEYIVLCDSDSYFSDIYSLDRATSYFLDPSVALVQFRNVGYTTTSDGQRLKILSLSVDFYDAFVSFLDNYGWSPFLGHNAVLRVSVLRDLGGFSPGDFADDIDYSVKLRLNGYRIRYARDIECGERHPSTYESLRLRTLKWSYGCTQILVRWSWSIIVSRRISSIEKLTFFLTVGYYHFQLLLLVYLSIFYLVIPFHDLHMRGLFNLLISSGLILILTFLPSITFFLRHNKIAQWPKIGVYWGLTYGSQDFVIAIGIIRCLLNLDMQWISTNAKIGSKKYYYYLPELLFGVCIVMVALLKNPTLLFLPTTILFAGKYLTTPFLNGFFFK